jgi:hypothetical protein
MSSKTTSTVTNEQLASMSGWRIARALGCHYTGDSDPIRHGGVFYSLKDWHAWGYASCVEFWEDPDTGMLVVSCGTINRPDSDEGMAAAYECLGQDWSDPQQRNNLCLQVEACRAYFSIELDDHERPFRFGLDNWKEARIWARVRHLIERLARD